MKKLILILLVTISYNHANAQFSENHAIYGSGEINFGNYFGIDLNVNYVYQEKYSLQLGITGNLRAGKSRPEDYRSGLAQAMFLGLANPYDQLDTYKISVGKIYKLNEKGSIRANLLFGIGITSIREPYNWQRRDGGWLGENYSWDYHRYNTVSLIINPKIEFPFTKFYGLTLSPMLQINKDRTYVGIGIGHMAGRLRKNTPKPESLPKNNQSSLKSKN